MQQNSKRLFLAMGLVGLVVLVGGCKKLTPPVTPSVNQSDEAAMKAKEEKAAMEKKAMDAATPFVLTAQNNSGETGTAKIFEVEGKAEVTLAVNGAPAGVEQPAHIHEGTCEKLGPVVFGLANVVNGESMTYLNVPLASIFNGSARALNVHKSQAEIGTYVACVDLTAAPKMEDKEKKDTMKDENENTNSNTNGNTNANTNSNTNQSASVKTFNITARNFSFSQNEIRVKKGDVVQINLNVVEGFHDWVVDEFNAAAKSSGSGATTGVQFTADKTGTFEYYCSVGNHRAMGMKGKLIVE
ncbi:MAG: cupredoxin domain-containing protein [Candidatus Komeilibacteria bacterium]|nr:cupredoxin domain-containing protein [Candidatus Komeilibacteria bacterium]